MDRKYLIIPVSELKKVEFDSVLEHSLETLNYSGDGKRTFIKWSESDPDFISDIKNAEGPYTLQEIREILTSDQWLSASKKKVT